MKLLWASNAPFAATGYGEQTKLMVDRLLADGHQVGIAANYGLEGVTLEWRPGCPIFPKGVEAYSSDILQPHARTWLGEKLDGWVLGLYDVWPLPPANFDKLKGRIAWWVPVDHAPAPLTTVEWFRRTGGIPIAMSEYGRDQLVAAGVADVHYIPHAIDLRVWHPTPSLSGGRDVREALRFPADAFMILVVAANKGRWPDRKNWGGIMRALGVFMAAHPDARAYIHTDSSGSTAGIDLTRLATHCGLRPDQVMFADLYAFATGRIPPDDLAALATAADVGLLPSMGEGFGLPVAEGMACGLPYIVADFSAQPEIVGDTGWLVEGQPWWDESHAADFYLPYTDAIVAALEAAYADRGNASRREAARVRIAERYDIDRVYPEQWRPFLAELDERLHPVPKPSRRERRQLARAAR